MHLLVEALDDDLPDDQEATEAVGRLGIDVAAFAAAIRQRVRDAEVARRKGVFAKARQAYLQEVTELAALPVEPVRPRAAQKKILQGLIAKAGPDAVAANFQKYEDADDEELAAMITSLQHLLSKRDGSE